MPSDLFEISSRRHGVRIVRPIVEADWARPLTYMARTEPDVLAMSLPGPCLFPRLECLRWDQYGGEFCFIQMLLAPTLTDISIECQPIHLSLLSSFARTCPALRDITLEVPSGDSSELKLFWETIRDIASVRNLALLRLKSLPLAPDPWLYSTLRIPGFSALRTLEIQAVPVGAAQLFLGMFRDISLEVLDLIMSYCVPTGAMKSFHSSIAAAVTHSSLTYLILDHAGDKAPTLGESSYTFDDSCIRPLLCFNSLIHVSTTSPLGFSVTDSMVDEALYKTAQRADIQMALVAMYHPASILLSLAVLALVACAAPQVPKSSIIERAYVVFKSSGCAVLEACKSSSDCTTASCAVCSQGECAPSAGRY
ncbi:hypothetical protein C8R47DRAFT_1228885 [Mycena vitilis]|nr:hypothetical protein C8R47DRAFT_1228882 [Mycena vitilis]KAJ6453877.1 hypothetical protein C8R47DRAFT_1228885 [Mycena vitilis]